MLNQNQSKKWNSWKYALVLPALTAFVFLFQIEVVAQEKENQKQETETKSESIDLKSFKVEKDLTNLSKGKEIYIDGKKSSQEELDKIDPDEIESVDVAKISGKKTILVTTKNNINKISKTIKLTDKTIYINDIKSTDEEFSKLDKNNIDKIDVNTFENTVRLTTKNEKPLIIIDGIKQDSNFKIEDLNPNNIQSINVLKGHHATMKYNESGKNGVMEITTKDKAGINKFQSIQSKTAEGFDSKEDKEVNGWKVSGFSTLDGYKPLIVVDGKAKESNFNIEDIPKENINKIDVLKGKIAQNKYGEKAKDGVIEITTKEKTSLNNLKPITGKAVQGFQALKQDTVKNDWIIGYNTNGTGNTISRIIDDKKINYKKAVIVIDGKQSDYKSLEKLNPKEVESVIEADIKNAPEEDRNKAIQLYGKKALNGFIQINTKTKNN